LAALLLLAGCAGIGQDTKPTQISAKNVDKLYGRSFELRYMTLNGERIVTHVDARMTIAFLPEGLAKGYGSVNQFSAGYSFGPDGKLTWTKGSFATSGKPGAPELVEKERQFLEGLRQVTAAVVSAYGLQLENDDGSTKLVFR
jgi:heat shock protein HslJ